MHRWQDLFYYDTESPTFLRWKEDVYSGKGLRNRHICSGDVAGSVPSESRLHSTVSVEGQYYLVHRIIYEMRSGEIPHGMSIDHVDGNGYNNSVDNLRLVSHAVNMRNMRKRVDNKTGVTGVSKSHARSGGVHFSATWKNSVGKQESRTYSASKYGNDEAFRLACEWRAAKIAELNEQGAGYTERHGT